MTRYSLDEGKSGSKSRKMKNAEEEEASKRRRWEPSGGETPSSPSAEEEEEEEEAEEEEEEEEEEDEEAEEEEEEEESEEDGDEEMKKSESCRRDSRDSEFLTFHIDADVLECSICFEPLRPPVFQCVNGHIACSSCSPKLFNKCHVCSGFIGHQRCLALEKVIESLKCQCQYANYGCRAILPFVERDSHEETCNYAALFCPVSNCTFSGSKQQLTNHVKTKHFNIAKKFSYGQSFMLILERQKSYLLLLGEDGRIFLLLNSRDSNSRNAVSVICIGLNVPECKISYELRVRRRESSLKLRSLAEKVKKWSGVHPTMACLVVPDCCFFPGDWMHIHVCIHGIPV